jgi:hypothetical protein
VNFVVRFALHPQGAQFWGWTVEKLDDRGPIPNACQSKFTGAAISDFGSS